MNAAAAVLSLAPGLALGSFLNVVAARVPLRRSVVSPPSACMSCGTRIAWHDNIPVVSWLLLRGRCRSCSAAIPWVYPGVELLTAALVAGCVLAFGVTLEALVAAFFCSVLVVVSATDLEHRIIPNRVVLPAAAVVLVAQTLLHPSPEWALGALGASGFLFAAALAYPAGMGMGDVKLAALIGVVMGSLGLRFVGVAAGAAIAFGGLGGVVALAMGRGRKSAIPFGPYLAAGAVVAGLWGEEIASWYIGRFL